MAYSEKVIEHYENPRNVGTLDKADPNVGTGLVGAPACGDVMKLQIKVNPQTGVIEDARFKTYGCGSAIASSSAKYLSSSCSSQAACNSSPSRRMCAARSVGEAKRGRSRRKVSLARN